MEKDYRKMLDRAYEELPDQLETTARFQIPRAYVRQQGRRTFIMNFKEIADELRREPSHLMKFLLNETATRGDYDGTRARFQGRFSSDSIRNLIEIYTNKYVVCPSATGLTPTSSGNADSASSSATPAGRAAA